MVVAHLSGTCAGGGGATEGGGAGCFGAGDLVIKAPPALISNCWRLQGKHVIRPSPLVVLDNPNISLVDDYLLYMREDFTKTEQRAGIV